MIEYALAMAGAAAAISLVRVAVGPTVPDRVLAFDTLGSVVIAIIALLSVYFGNGMLIDIAIVYALLSLLANLSISKYISGRKLHD